MQVARKITVAMLLTTIAAFAALGVVEVRRQVAVHEQNIAADLFDLGRGLGHAFHEVARSEGRERGREVVRYADERLHEVNISWISLDPAQGRDPHFARDRLKDLAAGREQMLVASNEDEGNGMLYVYVPIEGEGNGALELAQSLRKESEFKRKTLADQALAALLTAITVSLLASGLGLYFVGKPVQRLVAQARRVGAGDLSLRLALPQRDEIGELAGEMNAMCDRLEEARHRVDEASAARVKTLEELRHADRLMTVGKLASGIAHELGTPLNVVSGRAMMIAEAKGADAATLENARIIRSQTERMATIIRHLLDFARRREPRRVKADLGHIAKQTLALVAPLAQRQHVELALGPGDTDPVAFVDPMQMEQVISNLVVNGIQSMTKGGRLEIGLVRESLAAPTDESAEPQPCLSLYVKDEGEGISKENAGRVFEPFFTTKGVGEGTGLGLSVAYGIVLDHGGWISVDSEPGAGSRFGVHLPDPPLATPTPSAILGAA